MPSVSTRSNMAPSAGMEVGVRVTRMPTRTPASLSDRMPSMVRRKAPRRPRNESCTAPMPSRLTPT